MLQHIRSCGGWRSWTCSNSGVRARHSKGSQNRDRALVLALCMPHIAGSLCAGCGILPHFSRRCLPPDLGKRWPSKARDHSLNKASTLNGFQPSLEASSASKTAFLDHFLSPQLTLHHCPASHRPQQNERHDCRNNVEQRRHIKHRVPAAGCTRQHVC